MPIVLLGLAAAVLLHALWNGSSFLVADWFGFYGVVQVPLFVVAVVVVVLLRRQERRVTLERLGDYAAAGWLSPAEVRMIGTAEGRRTAMRWARTAGGDRPRAMSAFLRSATRLAHLRQQQVAGRGGRTGAVDERVLLEELVARRTALTGRSGQ